MLQRHSGSVSAVTFSPDGRTVASASLGMIKLWDVASGAEQRTLEGHFVQSRAFAFSPDGRTVASASLESIELWDAASGAKQRTLEDNDGCSAVRAAYSGSVNAVAFSPDGCTVTVASDDGMVKLWDATSVAEQRTPDHSILYIDDNRADRENTHVEPTSKIRIKRNWLVLEGRKMLWMPPDTRPRYCTFYDHSVVIGCLSGRMLYMAFDPSVEGNT
jgi:WD40 repeat protein